jgi:hypothetical protein
MAFHGDGIAGVLVQPCRLLVEGRRRLGREIRRIRLEEHTVADVDHEILRRTGRTSPASAERATGAASAARAIGGLVRRARGQRESCREDSDDSDGRGPRDRDHVRLLARIR